MFAYWKQEVRQFLIDNAKHPDIFGKMLQLIPPRSPGRQLQIEGFVRHIIDPTGHVKRSVGTGGEGVVHRVRFVFPF